VLGWGGVDVVRPVWRDLIGCLEIRLRVDAIVADGPVVAVRYTESGTSVRAFRGDGPTGRSYEVVACRRPVALQRSARVIFAVADEASAAH
jgi:hypothetical protein